MFVFFLHSLEGMISFLLLFPRQNGSLGAKKWGRPRDTKGKVLVCASEKKRATLSPFPRKNNPGFTLRGKKRSNHFQAQRISHEKKDSLLPAAQLNDDAK